MSKPLTRKEIEELTKQHVSTATKIIVGITLAVAGIILLLLNALLVCIVFKIFGVL